MSTIRRIPTSQIDGNDADTNNENEIRPYGEIGLYEGNNNKLELLISDGQRTHFRSKVLAKGTFYGGDADSADGSSYDTIKLIPDVGLVDNGSHQYIIVDPTGPNHVHIRAGGTIDNSSAELIIGGENSYVKIGAGENPQVSISSNSNSWTFGTDGSLVLPGAISFNTDAEIDLLQGQIAWNDTEGTIDIGLTDTVAVSIGEHTVFRVRNETGGPLYKGQAVYASNVHSNGIITPALYVADGSVREIRFMGLLLENIDHNNNGYAINFGHIFNIDTRGNVASNIAVGDETWADGDILYVHPTVAGKLTKVEPQHSISVAIVLDAANNGKIFVRPTSYGHLSDNHDVNLAGLENGDLLKYYYSSLDPNSSYWGPYKLNAIDIDFSNVPTSDPGQPGKVWVDTANGNVLKVSMSS